jgi:hypothetical protein
MKIWLVYISGMGKVGTGIDISALHPEVNWLTFKDWSGSKLR